MAYVLLISLLVMTAIAGAAIVLYFKERIAHQDFRDFHYRFMGNERQELTPEGVADAVRSCGYVPIMHEDNVEFKAGGHLYCVRTKELPYLVVESTRLYDADILDMDLFRQAAARITEETGIVKLSLFSDGELRIRTEAYEPDSFYFRESLKGYIGGIEDANVRICDCYDKCKGEKRIRQELEDFYLHRDNGNGKARKFLS